MQIACSISGLDAFSFCSMFTGDMFLPAELMISSFLAQVTTARLDTIRDLFDRGKLTARVGTVLPLEQARTAHEMLGGAPHSRGKTSWSSSSTSHWSLACDAGLVGAAALVNST